MEITRRRLLVAGSLGVLASSFGTDREAEAASSSSSEGEQAAIKLVTDFITTFPSRDVSRLAAFMDDYCEFQGAPWDTLWRGKQPFINEMTNLVDPSRGLVFAEEPRRIYAIGGTAGSGVLAERVDYRRSNPSNRGRLGAFFWVVNGKIKAWHDLPLRSRAEESSSEVEQAAVKLVTDFIATFPSKDVSRLAAFMDDYSEFQGAPTDTLWRGKQPFINEMTTLVDPSRDLVFAEKPSRIYAIGGAAGTGVLAERTDYLRHNPNRRIRLAAFFWVVSGKIKAWHDLGIGAVGGPGRGGPSAPSSS